MTQSESGDVVPMGATSERAPARFLRFVRFSHTVFAMPFALGAMFVAADGFPSAGVFALVVLAMVFARTSAMTFNRLVDWEIDRRNPRTAARHTLVSRRAAVVGCIVSAALFAATTWFLNPLCFWLWPVALATVFFYSLTKRFTNFAQFFLGLALAVAPVGAWLAVTGAFAWPPLVLAAGVVCWVAGFDIIYATQDHEFDRREGLRSMVVWLGVPAALRTAQWLHAALWLALVAFGWVAGLGWIYYAGLAPTLAMIVYEHRAAQSRDIAAINTAFFRSNAVIGLIFMLSTLVDRLA
jgi:4-hydroxybenzoate polyprenyltransferase